MEISVENAGARKGYLILKKEGQFIVETSILVNQEDAAGYPIALEECKEFCLPVINYTIRTGKDVLLSNAEKQGQFIGDPYIKRNRIKSMLCTPISDKGRMSGILNLENRQVVGAFTPERVKIMRIVSEILANAWARLEAEENILKHRSQLQKLSSQMLLTEERERRRIAVDLHDRIGHALSDIMLRLGIFKQSATDSESKGKINDVSEIVEQCIEDTHTLTFDISPPILYDLGLEAALDWLAEQTRIKHNINVQFEDDEQEKPLDESSRILLFQASRELLFNMVKHSQAKFATVSMERRHQHVKVVIKDDGVGFELDSKRNFENKKGGFGLFSIQERLAQQGGAITIESIPGEGTCITMEMPMKTVKQKVLN